MNKILTAPIVKMDQLSELFIELTSRNCNLKCKNCYIPIESKVNNNDFIDIDIIKENLNSKNLSNIKRIYLTGGEPLLHPQFNTILRMCLKKSDTIIMTNGVSINDKKARFYAKVESEEEKTYLGFQISIVHYDEIKNDAIRTRGSFRKAIGSVISLIKYGFNPLIIVVNHYKEEEKELIEKFLSFFLNHGIELNYDNFKVIEDVSEIKKDEELIEFNSEREIYTDCKTSRILTKLGVYSCCLLSNDHRGRLGANLNEFSQKMPLETEKCLYCIKNKKSMYVDYHI